MLGNVSAELCHLQPLGSHCKRFDQSVKDLAAGLILAVDDVVKLPLKVVLLVGVGFAFEMLRARNPAFCILLPRAFLDGAAIGSASWDFRISGFLPK